MGTSKYYKNWEIKRGKWPWQIDSVTIRLLTRYIDYNWEVHQYNVPDNILDDIRERLNDKISNEPDLKKVIKKSKNFFVTFSVQRPLGGYPKPPHYITIPFYIIDDEIYFKEDKAYKRAEQLKSIGI